MPARQDSPQQECQSRSKRGFCTLLLGAFIAISLVLSFLLWKQSEQFVAGPRVLVYADGGSTLSAPMYVAYHKTFFLSQGIAIQFAPYSSGRDALKAVTSGEADFATVADTPLVRAILDDELIRVVATIASSGESCALVAKKSIRHPSDLIGQKVGYHPGTNSEFFLNEFLIKHEIEKTEISWIPLKPEETEEAFASNAVVAISTYDPYATRLELSLKMNRFTAPDLYSFPWNIVVSKELLESPEIIDQLIKSLNVSENFIHSQEAESKGITARYLKINENEIDNLWSNIHFNINLGQSLIVNLERQLKSNLKNSKALAPDVTRYIYHQSLERTLPHRLTIIR